VAELRADAAVRRYAADHRLRRHPIRTALGHAMVRVGERLAAAPARSAVSQ
jgi:hypothetical protein